VTQEEYFQYQKMMAMQQAAHQGIGLYQAQKNQGNLGVLGVQANPLQNRYQDARHIPQPDPEPNTALLLLGDDE
jgi:hypothetical protein